MSQEKKNQVSSRWASEEEIKSSLYEVKLNDKKPKYGGIPLFFENVSVFVEDGDSHSLILGSTASKKTRLIGMPTIKLCTMAGESIIVTDPKAELYEKTYPILKKKGYNIFVLNLRNPLQSNCWNPLIILYRLYHSNMQDKAIELVNDMANCITKNDSHSVDPYWHNSASNLLAGLILILFECADESEINFKSLRALRTQAFKNDEDNAPFIRENFLKYINPSSFVCSLLSGTANVCNETRGCITSVFDQLLTPFFCQDNLINMLSDNHILMSEIGKKKTAVFLIIPDENTLYHSLVSVFIKQGYTELILEAQKQPKKKLPVRVNYLLDEFSSLPAISDFPAMVTASRSRNIRFNLIIQSYNQLFSRYGNDAETIKGNCENWVYLHSREKSTLEELCLLSGNKHDGEPLVSLTLLQTLDKNKGEAFILHKRQYPFLTTLLDIDCYPKTMTKKIKIQYPENNKKVQSVFNIEKFCDENGCYFLSQLFSGKTHEEISNDREGQEKFYMQDDEDIVTSFFTPTVLDDDYIESLRIKNLDRGLSYDEGE